MAEHREAEGQRKEATRLARLEKAEAQAQKKEVMQLARLEKAETQAREREALRIARLEMAEVQTARVGKRTADGAGLACSEEGAGSAKSVSAGSKRQRKGQTNSGPVKDADKVA